MNIDILFVYFSDTKVVGPFLPAPANPLSHEWEQFMQSAGKEGVILVSFGSIIQTLNDKIMSVLVEAFARLPQKIIWKQGSSGKCSSFWLLRL